MSADAEPIERQAAEVVDVVTLALAGLDTAQLVAARDYAKTQSPGSWLAQMLDDYLETWR